MQTYMIEFAYTHEAWAALSRNPVDRSDAVRALVEKIGGRFIGLYYMFGEYDGFVLFEAPDEVAATAVVIAAGMPGHLKATNTTILLTPQQLIESLHKTAGLSYRAPEG